MKLLHLISSYLVVILCVSQARADDLTVKFKPFPTGVDPAQVSVTVTTTPANALVQDDPIEIQIWVANEQGMFAKEPTQTIRGKLEPPDPKTGATLITARSARRGGYPIGSLIKVGIQVKQFTPDPTKPGEFRAASGQATQVFK